MPQKHDKNNYFGIKQFENVISTNSKKFKSKCMSCVNCVDS